MPNLKKQAQMNYNEKMLKQLLIICGATLTLLISFSYWSFNANFKKVVPRTSNMKQEIYIKNIKLSVDIADEPHEQTQGLSGKEYMAENEGMIFIFPESIIPAFWMKDMRFALDIIWIDAKNTIIGIEKNVLPETFPKIFSPPSPVKYVLEVNAGWSSNNKVNSGDKLKLN